MLFHQVIFQAAFCSFRLTKGSFIFKSSLAADHLFPGTFLRPVLFLVAVPVNQAIVCYFRKYMNQNKKQESQHFHGSSHFLFCLTALLLKSLFLPRNRLTKGSDIRLGTGDGHSLRDRRKNKWGRLWPHSHTLPCCWGDLGETGSSVQQLQTCVSSPSGPEANTTCASSRSLCRSLCKRARSAPAVRGGTNTCVCITGRKAA